MSEELKGYDNPELNEPDMAEDEVLIVGVMLMLNHTISEVSKRKGHDKSFVQDLTAIRDNCLFYLDRRNKAKVG